MNEHRVRNQVVEELYEETLLLADEARMVFDMRSRDRLDESADGVRVALSIEGLRTTTRLMNLLAWLLNQRAFFAGELTELQLQRSGALAADRRSDPVQMAQLHPATRALIRESERLYARAERLDIQLRSNDQTGPARGLQDRLSSAFAGS